MFLCFMGIMSSDDTSSNEKDTRSYRETSDVTQNKQTTEATKSVKVAETTQKSTASNQNNTTTQKSTTSARNNTTTQKSTATSTTKSTTSTSSTKVNGVTPELKTFCDEYEQLMDIYIYLMLYADEYEEQTGRDAMIDYFAALSKLATFEQAAAELADKEMTDADYAYYTASMLRIELKLLAALSGSDK